jgi:hypothetical protein
LLTTAAAVHVPTSRVETCARAHTQALTLTEEALLTKRHGCRRLLLLTVLGAVVVLLLRLLSIAVCARI